MTTPLPPNLYRFTDADFDGTSDWSRACEAAAKDHPMDKLSDPTKAARNRVIADVAAGVSPRDAFKALHAENRLSARKPAVKKARKPR